MDILRMFEKADNAEAYRAGMVIFSAGDPAELMYVVLDGEIELRKDGRLLNTIGPGSLLGELALIHKRPRSATAVARTDCRLAPVNEKRFLFLVQQTPFFALHVMRALGERIVQRDVEADR
jgi:cAMP-binding proteins - catabolite gene activator and regulatory subunit of cAMP-dependent protein kinases